MMDAYTHLDVASTDPISDFKSRMQSADIDRALVVETWKGDNDSSLKALIAAESPEFRVVPCFRPERHSVAMDLLDLPMVVGLRVRTMDLHRLGNLSCRLESSGKWLVPHAEQGVGLLTTKIITLVGQFPRLKIYFPHCAWPRGQNKLDDEGWEDSILKLSVLPNLIMGISALSYFSTEPFPHVDVRSFVTRLVKLFGGNSIVAASDYPMFEKTLYSDYIRLAQRWIIEEDANWFPKFESLIFDDNQTNDH